MSQNQSFGSQNVREEQSHLTYQSNEKTQHHLPANGH